MARSSGFGTPPPSAPGASATTPREPAWRLPFGALLRHSLRWRLVLAFMVLAVATTAVFIAGSKRLLQSGWQSFARPLVADYVDRLAGEIGNPPDLDRARALVQRLPITLRIDGPQLQYDSHPRMGRQGRPLRDGRDGRDGHDERGEREGPPVPAEVSAPGEPALHGGASVPAAGPPGVGAGPPGVGAVPSGAGAAAHRGGPRRWDHRVFGPDFDAEEWGLVRYTTDGHRLQFGLRGPPRADRPRLFGWLTLGALLLLLWAAFAYVRRLLAPIDEIGAGVARYGQGQFATPIAVRDGGELGTLAARINRMAASLQGMLEAKRALLLAISHELRSPLTRARLNAELVEEGEARDALLRDLGEMRDLITDLLESERLAQGHAALQTEPVDLAALVREGVAAQFADAPLVLDLQPGLDTVQADPVRLRLLLRNLIGNALRHGRGGPASPPVEVRLAREADGRLVLAVRDHGPGVTPEQLARLAEPFHRTDAARSRSAGGVGLGLYLCRLVAEAHGARLVLENAAPGLRAAMVWPAGFDSDPADDPGVGPLP